MALTARRVFLLSPARLDGERARILLRDEARFPLALALRSPGGAPLGELFAFISGLYFRGKLAYARAFASDGDAYVITASRGLVPIDKRFDRRRLRALGDTPIDEREERYLRPLERDARALARRCQGAEMVLLGSVSTAKYLEPLRRALGDQLRYPRDFAGRGDMSRGAILLRAARAGVELDYEPAPMVRPRAVGRRGRAG